MLADVAGNAREEMEVATQLKVRPFLCFHVGYSVPIVLRITLDW